MKTDNGKLKILSSKYDYLIAFFMAAMMNCAALAISGTLPGQKWRFGGDVVSGNLNGGFWKYLFEGHIPDYRWNVGLGGGTLLSIAYGGMSPFNIFAYLIPDKYAAYMLIIILETGVSAMLMQIFIKKVLKLESNNSIILACCYALGAYPTVYFGCLCLNDSVYMLPMVFLAMNELLRKKKVLPLSLAYAYCFICQFYCGFIVGIFSLICFILFLILKEKEVDRAGLKKMVSGYLIAGILAVLVSMSALFPVIRSYIGDGGSAFNISEGIRFLNPLLMLGSPFWGRGIALNEEAPCIYCGILTVLVCIHLFLNREVNRKEKLFWGMILLIMAVSLFVNPIYRFWHIFNRPDGYTARFAVIISFVIVSVAARGFKFLPEGKENERTLAGMGIGVFFLLIVAYVAWTATADRSFSHPIRMFVGNAFLIVLWMLILYFKIVKDVRRLWWGIAVVALAVIELTAASCVIFKEYGDIDASEYNADRLATEVFLEKIRSDIESEDGGDSARTHISGLPFNQGDIYDYMGVSMYSPAQNGHFLDTFYHMGDGISVSVLTYDGKTDFSDMILGVRYRGKLVNDGSGRNVAFDKNEKALPIGFMVSEDIKGFPKLTTNPFNNQNMIATAMSGRSMEIWSEAGDRSLESSNLEMAIRPDGSGMIRKVSEDEVGAAILSVPKSDFEHAYVYFSRMSNDGVKVHKAGGKIMDIELQSEGDRAGNGIRRLEIYNSLLEMASAENEFYCVIADFDDPESVYEFNDLYIYYQDEEKLNDLYDELNDGGWNEEEFTDGYIKASVDVTGDKTVLFMSIPYDKHWKAYLDGTETVVNPVINDTFCSIDLPQGIHTVEMRYVVPGRKTGYMLAVLGLLGWGSVISCELMTRFKKNPT